MARRSTGTTFSDATRASDVTAGRSGPVPGGQPVGAWVRGLRPPKTPADPGRANGYLVERERLIIDDVNTVLTVFLAGRECPYSCVYCDLWKGTLQGDTPPGSLPRQLEAVLQEVTAAGHFDDGEGLGLKLYNASNFFDSRAVPLADHRALADVINGSGAYFETVTVESHPCLVLGANLDFADWIDGELEVAMGLETVHEAALARLNKRMTVQDFDRAAEYLHTLDVMVRAFVLVGVPFVPPEEDLEWVVRSVEHAVDRGAWYVSLIPVRGGNGALEALVERGEFTPPSLAHLEDALDATLTECAVVTADLWDLDRLADCPGCAEDRRLRLERINLSGRREPRIECDLCRAGGR